ncbi:MAG: serine hydrolase domain-containing protein [Candidatus Binatus sp.]
MKIGNPAEIGIDPARLDRVAAAIRQDVASNRYDGVVYAVARGGVVAAHEAVGFADRASSRAARTDDIFAIMSITKTMTTAAVLARVERGELLLTTKIADVIPEFGVKGKQRISVAHLLTHTGGMSATPALPPELFGNLEAFVAAACQQLPDSVPGSAVSYSALSAHAVLAEVVRRLDGERRSFRDILAQEFFEPLAMKDTALGRRKDLAARFVPIVVRDRTLGVFQPELLEAMNALLTAEAEIPAGGVVSTAGDILRWAEMLRRGGELDGVRVLSPASIRLAATNHTGTLPNNLFSYAYKARGWGEFPAYLGLSFFIRGTGIFPHPFGTTASPSTFGGLGAGSTMFWVDRERDLTFVCLTAGLLEESRNFDRLQRLSDMVLASVVN